MFSYLKSFVYNTDRPLSVELQQICDNYEKKTGRIVQLTVVENKFGQYCINNFKDRKIKVTIDLREFHMKDNLLVHNYWGNSWNNYSFELLEQLNGEHESFNVMRTMFPNILVSMSNGAGDNELSISTGGSLSICHKIGTFDFV